MRCSDCRRYKTGQCYANPTVKDHESAERFTCFVPLNLAGTDKDEAARVRGQPQGAVHQGLNAEQLVVKVEPLPAMPGKPREVPPDSASPQSRGCPYCGTVLEPRPKRKKACPSCGEIIVVRHGLLLTRTAAERMDLLYRYGIDEQEFLSVEEPLRKNFNRAPPRDVVWMILQRRYDIAQMSSDYQSLHLVSWSQATFLHEEGRTAFNPLQEAARWSLKAEQAHGLKKVVIQGANDDYMCVQCKLLVGKILDISKALESMPIPVKDCPFCRCSYCGVADSLD